jgi:hypothetical protein
MHQCQTVFAAGNTDQYPVAIFDQPVFCDSLSGKAAQFFEYITHNMKMRREKLPAQRVYTVIRA